jgi:hypothetical protein
MACASATVVVPGASMGRSQVEALSARRQAGIAVRAGTLRIGHLDRRGERAVAWRAGCALYRDFTVVPHAPSSSVAAGGRRYRSSVPACIHSRVTCVSPPGSK